MNKKTEVITFRTDSETKSKLAKIAEAHDWSIAQVVDKICRKYFETDSTDENKNYQIIKNQTININNN